MSIWNPPERAAYEQDVAALALTAPSQRVASLPGPSQADDDLDGPSGLPRAVEKQLADDLAFLAAWEGTPDSVSAAALQRTPGSSVLKITIAANFGVAPKAEAALQAILRSLRQCAERSKSRPSTRGKANAEGLM
jgi:hypothetical protein